MCQNIIFALFGLIIFFAPAAAFADLPSLMADKTAASPPARISAADLSVARLLGADSPFRGKLSFLGAVAVDYRFAREGLKASFKRGSAWVVNTAIGYAGHRHVELNWRASGGTLKLAVGADDRSSGYRLEFAREF